MPMMPPRHRPPGQLPRAEAERKRKALADARRPSWGGRGYDKDWFAFRAQFLRANPICCCGCGKPAEVVDHVISIRQRPDLRLVASNCRPMTKRCHDRRTARDQAFGRNDRAGGPNL
jgi:5-methylcytosine-specific restriction endonuclease McrA